jgi:hypothetical protein
MRPEELRSLLRARPFVAFRLYLTDGAQYDVRHPDLMLVGERSAIVGQTSDPHKTFYELYTTVVLVHIVRIEPLPTPAPANGS